MKMAAYIAFFITKLFEMNDKFLRQIRIERFY